MRILPVKLLKAIDTKAIHTPFPHENDGHAFSSQSSIFGLSFRALFDIIFFVFDSFLINPSVYLGQHIAYG